MGDEQTLDLQAQIQRMTAPAGADQLLDWEASIELPPARPKGTVQVQLQYAGRSRPLPVPDSSEE